MASPASEIYNMNQGRSNGEVDISQPSEFNVFINQSTMYLWDWEDEKIHSRRAEKVVDTKEFEKFKEHMKHLYKDIFQSPHKDHSLKSNFADTIQFFRTTQPKKKLFCRIEGNYVVKKCFTEGVQYVKQGETHTYKVIGRALDIYTTDSPLESKSFRSIYDKYTNIKKIRLLNGQTKIIHSNTYYILIAPCHTFFIKMKLNTPGVENSTEISPSFATEADFQTTNVAEDRNRFPSSERTIQTEESSMLPGPSESRDDVYGNSRRRSMEIDGVSEPEMVNDSASRGITPYEIRPPKRVKYSTPLSKPSTSRMESSTSVSPVPNYLRDEREFDRVSEPEMVNDIANSSTRSYDSETQSKRMKYSTPLSRPPTSQMQMDLVPPSPNTLRDEVERISNLQAMNSSSDLHSRAVFAIRKEKGIESYALRPGSTFQVLQDNIMTGSFTIANDDMDPCVFEYHGEVQYIREVARFKNKSTFETTLTVQKDLLNELQDPSKRTEKVVVNYFFQFTFKAIEAAYKKFSEMQNMKMIGSCVPAIVPMSNAKFCGAVPDTYEAKPY